MLNNGNFGLNMVFISEGLPIVAALDFMEALNGVLYFFSCYEKMMDTKYLAVCCYQCVTISVVNMPERLGH